MKVELSIIIPTLNEEHSIGGLLHYLSNLKSGNPIFEIIVVDADSSDNTAEIVSAYDVVFLSSKVRGRAHQMAMGANRASGEILYFLHADTFPPKNFVTEIKQAVQNGFSFGCFRIKFRPSTSFLRFFEHFVKFPIMLARGGDQSLFVTKTAYAKCGGFDFELQFLEDLDIIKKLSMYSKIKIFTGYVTSSSRKFQKRGQVKLQWTYAKIHILYWLGYPPNNIYELYKNIIEK